MHSFKNQTNLCFIYGKEHPTPSRIVDENESWLTTYDKMFPSASFFTLV